MVEYYNDYRRKLILISASGMHDLPRETLTITGGIYGVNEKTLLNIQSTDVLRQMTWLNSHKMNSRMCVGASLANKRKAQAKIIIQVACTIYVKGRNIDWIT